MTNDTPKFVIPERTSTDAVDFEDSVERLSEGMRLCARKGCSRLFAPYRSFQLYCSQKCRDGSKSKRKRYVKQPERNVECAECHKVFVTNDGKRHYCSSTCYEKHERDRRAESEERTCIVCNKVFSTTHWSKRYCSEVCRMEARQMRATSGLV